MNYLISLGKVIKWMQWQRGSKQGYCPCKKNPGNDSYWRYSSQDSMRNSKPLEDRLGMGEGIIKKKKKAHKKGTAV